MVTTATYDTGGDNGITVGLPLRSHGLTLEQQQALKIMHYDGGVWVDVTTSVDTTADVVYGSVTHFCGSQSVSIPGRRPPPPPEPTPSGTTRR